MPEIECQFPDCTFKAEHASEAIALAMFNSHLASHQRNTASGTTKQKVPPIQRPEIRQDINDEEWATFVTEWSHFKRCTDIPTGGVADQLFQCCEKGLGRLLIRENPNIIAEGEEELLHAIKRMAVIKVAIGLRRHNLLSAKQDHGESFREYYANVKAAASTCNYIIKCPHQCCTANPSIDYTSKVVKDVLIAGIADNDIRKEVLGWTELDNKSDKELVTFFEEKELVKNAWTRNPVEAAGISGYRKELTNVDTDIDPVTKKKLAMKGKCERCNSVISPYIRYSRSGKINRFAFQMCSKCHKEKNRQQQSCGNNGLSGSDHDKRPLEGSAITSFIGALDTHPNDRVDPSLLIDSLTKSASQAGKQSVALDHHIFTKNGWQKVSKLSHPTIRLRITTNEVDFSEFSMPHPSIAPKHIDVIVDSGAQSCLWSKREFLRCGFNSEDLIPVRHTMKAANTDLIKIDGAIFLRLSGRTTNGNPVEAAAIVYISPDARSFYISQDVMTQLGIIPYDFPQLGTTLPVPTESECQAVYSNKPKTPSCDDNSPLLADCGCLKRQLPPRRPSELPFPCNSENAGRMKKWLLNRYSASTFNKCPHQILPEMEGPPIKIHVDREAKPVAMRTHAPVPLHWQDRVEQELYRDVALGVLEKVPHGEPTTWCFRMVITRKHDGGPRRTVDLSPLNKFCEREAHASKSPFHLARSVPPDSIKSCFDVWNGYHSVPIRDADRHLTTFITPWGLFRYKRAPQGFLSSGDGFNRRFDDIAAHIVRMERCVDDSLLHDNDLEEHWWRVIEFLELTGKTGIVINPEKFQFAQPTVDFAGFRISNNSVEPLPKYIDAIREFPKPENITDIRSWFGLVNQVSNYAQLRNMMEPFRRFLSPKVKFTWNDELDTIFEESKNHIIEAIREGVRIFDITKRTCLRTDWSKKGIGYFLAQQHCNCADYS